MSSLQPQHTTLRLSVSPDGQPLAELARAADILRAGGLVAFPTETVYGLGADATNAEAVQRIFVAKGRPSSDPLIVHLADNSELASVADDIPQAALKLAAVFWPGPLTLVVPRGERIPALVAAGGATLGVRVPASPIARALIRAAGVPVAAPSANRFMHTSPTTAEHVLADLDGRIDCVVDGGPTAIGVESTVLDLTVSPPRVLRPGGVTLEALRLILPDVMGPSSEREILAVARAPGQMDQHYAPNTPLVVFGGQGERAMVAMRHEAEVAQRRGLKVGALLPDAEVARMLDVVARTEPLGESLEEISHHLYSALRALDAVGLDLILAHTFGTEGLGLALEDRLRRAAGGSLRPV